MTAPVTVTREDEYCANQLWALSLNWGSRKEMAECVARHRQQADAASKAREDALVEALREVGRKAWGNPDSRTCREIEEIIRPILLARAKASSDGGEG